MTDLKFLSTGSAFLAETVEGTRSFVAGIWFPVGSRHEAPHQRGFTHFIEHMLFKGTNTRDAMSIARQFDRTGGFVNAFTEKDCVCIHCIVPLRSWKIAVELLSEMTFASVFPEDEFEREKEVVAAEILQIEDDPDETSHDAFLSRIWSGDPAALPITGTEKELRAIERDEAYNFYRNIFSPSRAIIAVASPMANSLVAEAFDIEIQNALMKIPPVRMPDEYLSITDMIRTPRFKGGNSFLRSDISQIYYYQAVQFDPPFMQNDFYVLSALNSIIGDSSGSRLFQELREKRGLCYSVSSGFADSPTECLWLAQVVSSSKHFPAMFNTCDEVLEGISSAALLEEDCKEAVSRLLGSYEIALDDPDFRMRRMARQYMIAGEVLSIEETGKRYASVEPDQIRSLASRLFHYSPRARFAFGKLGIKNEKILGGAPYAIPR